MSTSVVHIPNWHSMSKESQLEALLSVAAKHEKVRVVVEPELARVEPRCGEVQRDNPTAEQWRN